MINFSKKNNILISQIDFFSSKFYNLSHQTIHNKKNVTQHTTPFNSPECYATRITTESHQGSRIRTRGKAKLSSHQFFIVIVVCMYRSSNQQLYDFCVKMLGACARGNSFIQCVGIHINVYDSIGVVGLSLNIPWIRCI